MMQSVILPLAHCESHLPSGMGALEGGGLGLVHLCVPLGAKSRVGAPERCLNSQVRDGRLTQMIPLLSDCSRSPWHLVLGNRSSVPLVLQGLRLLPAEAAACRGPAPGARKPAPPPATAVLGLSSTHRPSGKRAGRSLFSVTALEPHP